MIVHSFVAASPVCSAAGCCLHPDSFSAAAQSCLVPSPLEAPSLGLLHCSCGLSVLTDAAPGPVPCSLTLCTGAEGQGKGGCDWAALSSFGHVQGNSKEWRREQGNMMKRGTEMEFHVLSLKWVHCPEQSPLWQPGVIFFFPFFSPHRWLENKMFQYLILLQLLIRLHNMGLCGFYYVRNLCFTRGFGRGNVILCHGCPW